MYNFINSLRCEAEITPEDILDIEKKYKFEFPKMLKDFYLKYNGAQINLCCIEIDGYYYEISDLVMLKYGICCFEKIRENDLEDDIIDNNLFPLANNRGGDYYYWNKETENVYLIYGDDIENPIYICKSIKELFDIMQNS